MHELYGVRPNTDYQERQCRLIEWPSLALAFRYIHDSPLSSCIAVDRKGEVTLKLDGAIAVAYGGTSWDLRTPLGTRLLQP